MKLREKIKQRKAKIGVIGLGYVGLPLAVEFAQAGFSTFGFETDLEKVKAINEGHSYITDVPTRTVRNLVRRKKIKAYQDKSLLEEMDIIIICVPTPLRKTREPDISYIVGAVQEITNYQRPGQLVVLESTTYPGTTEEIVLPILQRTGLKVGEDFYLAFSPERVDPGNKKYTIKNTPKIVAGVTKRCQNLVKLCYEQIVEVVIPVSSPRAAEMIKLWENTFRSVNIALACEMCLLCDRMGLDVWEVIKGAASKPFGFMPFYPGPGLGGHCIPIDPFYLSWKARLHNFEPAFIELAGRINNQMPQYVVGKVVDLLNEMGKCVRGAKILILGVAYKKNVGDTRESPAFEIIETLLKKGGRVFYHDPFVERFKNEFFDLKSIELTEKNLKKMDCVVLVTDHQQLNYKLIVQSARKILDTRNALGAFTGSKQVSEKIVCI